MPSDNLNCLFPSKKFLPRTYSFSHISQPAKICLRKRYFGQQIHWFPWINGRFVYIGFSHSLATVGTLLSFHSYKTTEFCCSREYKMHLPFCVFWQNTKGNNVSVVGYPNGNLRETYSYWVSGSDVLYMCNVFLFSIECKSFFVNTMFNHCVSVSQQKQPIFHVATSGYLARWRLRKKLRNSMLMTLPSAKYWVVSFDRLKQIFNRSEALPRSG